MKKNKLWMLACSLGLLAACDDILEQDISNKQVVVVAPGEGVHLQQNEVTFLWEPVQGASGYLLQVVTPSFEAAETVVVDTFVVATRFQYQFGPGTYAWRISPENSAYYGQYTYRTFTVDSAAGMPDTRRLRLLSPANATVTRETSLRFRWNAFDGASEYLLRISGAADSTLISSDTSLTVAFKTFDDTLRWQVLALLPDQSKYFASEKRWFFIDQEPGAATLTAPAANTNFSTDQAITFNWDLTAPPDFKEYIFTLYRVENNQQTRLEQLPVTAGSLTRYGLGQPLTRGQYLWEIQTVDRFGNISPVGTSTRTFAIQ